MAKHAKLSASGSSRWLNCPGSIRLCEDIPDTTNAAAEEGTRAHEAAEVCLNSGANHDDEYIQQYMDYVRGLVESGDNLMVELRLDYTHICEGGFGTADAIIVSSDKKYAHVIDLKYGMMRVSAYDNPQLRLYACGVLHSFPTLEHITVHIVQPRIDNFDSVEYRAEELNDFADYVRPIALVALSDDAPLVPSDNACKWCRGRDVCPALLGVVTDCFDIVTSGVEVGVDDKLMLLQNKKLIETYLKNLFDSAVVAAIDSGTAPPGFSLVVSKTNRRYNEDAELVLVDALGDAAYQTPNLITFAQCKKLKINIDDITYKPIGAMTIVPTKD